MTLEDFFTLSELSNGLTAPSRIRELVAVMEKVTESSGKNISDVIRQWSTVARAISATDNKDCLDLFVQIRGLNCIAKWLNHSQKLVTEENDSSIEDTVTHLLRALETFHVDHENLVNSEIGATVKDLLAHNSPKVHSGARVLFEKWENKAGSSNVSLLEKEKTGALNENKSGGIQEVKRVSALSGSSLGNTHHSQEISAEEDKVNDLPRDETYLSANKDVEDSRDGFLNNVGNKVDSIEPENAKSTLETPRSTGKTPVESYSPVPNIENLPVELPSLEESKPHEGTSVAEIRSKNSCDKSSPVNGSGDAKECDGQTMSSKSSSSDKRLENMKEFRSLHTGIESDGKVKRRDLLTSGCDLANSYGLGRKHTDKEDAVKSGVKEPDFGIVDPLEVARQVAIEVEREVVDYRQQSFNSSDKLPQNNMETSRVGDDGSPKETKSDSFGSDEDSELQEDSTSGNSDAEQRDETQVTEAAKTEINKEKALCGFDLNQVSAEDAENDHIRPNSSSFLMVPASRPTAAHGLPTVPLQFEGNLGWKGTAATSAFRPASPRRVPENEKQLHPGESSGSKKDELFLGFDLNVAENVDPRESFPYMSSRRSENMGLDLNNDGGGGGRGGGGGGGSGGGGGQDWLFGKPFPHQSSSGSSSLSKQPISFIDLNDQPSFLSNTDYSKQPPQIFDAFGSSKSTETGFFIFGAKVEIGPKVNAPQAIMSLSNGHQTPELALNATNTGQTRSFFGVAPPMVQYTNAPSVYGYNNILCGPAVYGPGGPVPYMVDSRGSPVVPQMMGSTSAFQNPFPQPPFAMTMNPSNGAGPSRGTLDLNSGSMAESSSRDTSSFGPFLNLGHVGSMEEQMRSGSKRKEPENGWENYGLRPYTPPWK